MTGSGPFGREPAGEFNFSLPPIGSVIYLEPTPKRIRVQVGQETIADSRRAFLLHEAGHQPIYYFPREDVREDVLQSSDRHTRCPKKGEASYFTIVAGGETVEAGAWYYPETPDGAPAQLAGLVAFYFNRMGRWLEEGEEITGHPRDPYHRIDVRASDRHIRVSLDGQALADTTRAMALFETGLPTRWYIPRKDVSAQLQPSDTTTYCPYKGTAGYLSVQRDGGEPATDLVWFYADPLEDATRVRDLVCFFNEKVDIELDGGPQQHPESPWSQGVRPGAQNAAPAATRG